MPELNERIAELYLRMYDFLLDYAQVNLGSHALAEEAVQETFEIACQRQEELFSSVRPEGWILNRLKNVMDNTKRNREADNNLIHRYTSVYYRELEAAEDSVRVEVLYDNLAEMEELKLIKELTVDGLTYLEMAQKRGISVAACRKRVQRARETLRKKLLTERGDRNGCE